MTVNTDTKTATGTGDGVTTAFTFAFGIHATSELIVQVVTTATGDPATKTETTDYVVSATNNDYWAGPGGTVTFTTAPTALETVFIYRDPAFTQTYNLNAQRTFQTASTTNMEETLDRIVTQIQRNKLDNDLSIKIQPHENGLDMELPNVIDRAGKYAAYDATGQPSAAAGTGDATPHTAVGTALASASDEAAGRAAINASAIYDNRDYANLAAAITAIGATVAELHIWDQETLTANISFPTTTTVVFHNGGYITGASTYTVEFLGQLEAGLYRIFDNFTAANDYIILGPENGCTPVPHWWGAVGDASTDNTEAFQSCINACITFRSIYGEGRHMRLPVGDYSIETELIADSAYGFGIIGDSMEKSQIIWNGSTGTESMLVLRDIGWGLFANFHMQANTACSAQIICENGSGATNTPTTNVFRQLWLDGTTVGAGTPYKADYGIYLRQGAGLDNNSENHEIQMCDIRYHLEANVRVGHSQAKHLKVLNTHLQYAPYGVYCKADSGSQTMNFYSHGCNGGRHTVSDFYVETLTAEPTVIDGFMCEESAMLWSDNNGNAARGNITIRHCRFDSGQVAADGIFIDSGANGNVTIESNSFLLSSAPSDVPIINWHPASNDNNTAVIRGNLFQSGNAANPNAASGLSASIVLGSNAQVYGNLDISANLYADDTGTILNNRQFVDSDTTPSVWDGTVFESNTTATTVTTFDDSHNGKTFSVTSRGNITYDFTTGTPTLLGSPVDVVTASGDTTYWLTEGVTTTSVRHQLVKVVRATESAEIRQAIVDLSNANIKALSGTPIELVAAQGAGTLIELVSAVAILNFRDGSEVLAEPSAPDDLAVNYDGSTGDKIRTMDSTGFITSSADAMLIFGGGNLGSSASAFLTASNVNKNVAIYNTGGDYTGNASNDTTMRVITTYRVHRNLGL